VLSLAVVEVVDMEEIEEDEQECMFLVKEV
jgi:hypothetical protein